MFLECITEEGGIFDDYVQVQEESDESRRPLKSGSGIPSLQAGMVGIRQNGILLAHFVHSKGL